jgi:hypothetical protein
MAPHCGPWTAGDAVKYVAWAWAVSVVLAFLSPLAGLGAAGAIYLAVVTGGFWLLCMGGLAVHGVIRLARRRP